MQETSSSIIYVMGVLEFHTKCANSGLQFYILGSILTAIKFTLHVNCVLGCFPIIININIVSDHNVDSENISEMDPSATFGKVYVFRIKPTNKNDWFAPDMVYGFAHEGVDGMTFTNFKELVAKKNKKCFLTKRANPDEDRF